MLQLGRMSRVMAAAGAMLFLGIVVLAALDHSWWEALLAGVPLRWFLTGAIRGRDPVAQHDAQRSFRLDRREPLLPGLVGFATLLLCVALYLLFTHRLRF